MSIPKEPPAVPAVTPPEVGQLIRITRCAISLGEFDAWLKHSGYVDLSVRTSSSRRVIGLLRGGVPIVDVTFHVIEPLRPGALVVFRRYLNRGAVIRSSQGQSSLFNHLCPMKVVSCNHTDSDVLALAHSERLGDDVQSYAHHHEVRPLRKEELAWLEAHRKPAVVTSEDIVQALGPVLCDVIRQYPTAPATRGLVFARTETYLTDEDTDYDRIIERLRNRPGKLIVNEGHGDLRLPEAMVMRCQEQADRELGFIDFAVRDNPAANPLTALDDDDLVEVEVEASQVIRRILYESTLVDHSGTIRIPASVVRLGRRAVMRWLRGNQDELPGDDDDANFETDRIEDSEPEDLDINRISFGELDEFVTEEGLDERPVASPIHVDLPVEPGGPTERLINMVRDMERVVEPPPPWAVAVPPLVINPLEALIQEAHYRRTERPTTPPAIRYDPARTLDDGPPW